MFPVHLEHLNHRQDMQPCKVTAIIGAFATLQGLSDYFPQSGKLSKSRCELFFQFPLLVQIFVVWWMIAVGHIYISFFNFLSNPNNRNIGQSYCLCLQIEWQLSKRRKAFGVLGYPEKISMDNGQARTITALEDIRFLRCSPLLRNCQ